MRGQLVLARVRRQAAYATRMRPNIFPALHYRDPEAALGRVTRAFDFDEKAVLPAPRSPASRWNSPTAHASTALAIPRGTYGRSEHTTRTVWSSAREEAEHHGWTVIMGLMGALGAKVSEVG
jgi:hypothetical protein